MLKNLVAYFKNQNIDPLSYPTYFVWIQMIYSAKFKCFNHSTRYNVLCTPTAYKNFTNLVIYSASQLTLFCVGSVWWEAMSIFSKIHAKILPSSTFSSSTPISCGSFYIIFSYFSSPSKYYNCLWLRHLLQFVPKLKTPETLQIIRSHIRVILNCTYICLIACFWISSFWIVRNVKWRTY